MLKRYDISVFFEEHKKVLDLKKKRQGIFPSTPLEAYNWDYWINFKEDSKVSVFDEMPQRVQDKYREIAAKILTRFPNAKVYAVGSTVNGGYVDNESNEDEIQAYQMLKGNKFSDIDIFIEGQFNASELQDIGADILPIAIGKKIPID